MSGFFFIFFIFQETVERDAMARTTDPELDIYAYLAYAYQHQFFQSVEDEELVEVKVDESIKNTKT